MDLQSLGHASQQHQQSPKRLYEALEKLKIRPAMWLNDVAYYERQDVETAVSEIIIGEAGTDA